MEINLPKISAIHKLFLVLFAIHLLSGFCGYQWNIVFYFGAFCQRVALFYIIILHAGFIIFPDICNRDVFFFCVSHRNLFINTTRAAIFWGEFISASKNTRVESVACVVAWWWYLCAVMFLAGTRRERACYSCSWPEGRLKINTRIFSACSTTTTHREYFCFVSKYLRFSVYIMPVFNITLVFFYAGHLPSMLLEQKYVYLFPGEYVCRCVCGLKYRAALDNASLDGWRHSRAHPAHLT